MSERFQILSLDGGGMKGTLTAALLAHFEEALGHPISNHFDLITGTSTGGIIALGLGLGIPAKEILAFYVESGPKIFPHPKLRFLQHFFRRKFSNKGLEAELRKETRFGERKLGESTKRLVIPSFDLHNNSVHLFKTRHHRRFEIDHKIEVWKIAMATAAAPTYFPSAEHIDHCLLVDGGVWANNPIMVGIVEALTTLDQKVENIRALSIGTTWEVARNSPRLRTGGKFAWVWHEGIPNVILQGQAKGVEGQAMLLLNKHKEPHRYLRIDLPTPKGCYDLDKNSPKEILRDAEHLARHNLPALRDHFADHTAKEFIPIPTT